MIELSGNLEYETRDSYSSSKHAFPQELDVMLNVPKK